MQQLDLNLLVALDALLAEESVTLAAAKLNLSVSAMSRVLGRIRSFLNDPILVRAGMRLVPTQRATELRPRVAALVSEARALVAATDSTRPDRTFVIRAGEAFAVLFEPLAARLEQHAPNVRLRLVARTNDELELLREGEVHLEVGEIRTRAPEIKRQKLFRVTSIGAACVDHPIFRGALTAKKYAQYRHVNASRRGASDTPIDRELEKLALKRVVALVVPSFYQAMFAALSSRLVATIPDVLAATAEQIGLRTFSIPVPIEPITISQAWHPRFTSDPIHRLIRESLVRACSRSYPNAT